MSGDIGSDSLLHGVASHVEERCVRAILRSDDGLASKKRRLLEVSAAAAGAAIFVEASMQSASAGGEERAPCPKAPATAGASGASGATAAVAESVQDGLLVSGWRRRRQAAASAAAAPGPECVAAERGEARED